MTTQEDHSDSAPRVNKYRQQLKADDYHRVDVSMPNSTRSRLEEIAAAEKTSYANVVSAFAQRGLAAYESEQGAPSPDIRGATVSDLVDIRSMLVDETHTPAVAFAQSLERVAAQRLLPLSTSLAEPFARSSSMSLCTSASLWPASGTQQFASSSLASFLRKRKSAA